MNKCEAPAMAMMAAAQAIMKTAQTARNADGLLLAASHAIAQSPTTNAVTRTSSFVGKKSR